jgi:hypothetical protein
MGGRRMTPDQIQKNNEINIFLQKQGKLEAEMEKTNPQKARIMRRWTSVVAEMAILANGLDIALKNFWLERRAI